MYETQGLVPLADDVTGSFTVIRYVKDAVNTAGGGPDGAQNSGNGIGNWTKAIQHQDGYGVPFGTPFGAGSDEGNAHRSFVPRLLNTGHHFDIEIRQFVPVMNPPTAPGGGLPNWDTLKHSNTHAAREAISIQRATDAFNRNINRIAGDEGIPIGQCGVAKLKKCRINSANFSLNRKTVAVQTFQFMARYVDEDSFVAAQSGIGQDKP